jgi:hypothetical protein
MKELKFYISDAEKINRKYHGKHIAIVDDKVVAKLMSELMETIEILSDPKMMKAQRTLKLEESRSCTRF